MEAASSTLMSQEMTWLLKDLEDNLFVTRSGVVSVRSCCTVRRVLFCCYSCGFSLLCAMCATPRLDERWFSHGGVTIQASLMDLAIDYLRRGEIEARPEGPVQLLQTSLR